MVASTSIPISLAASKSSLSDFPVISKPVKCFIESAMVTLAYGALKSTSCSPKVVFVVPFTAIAQCSNKRSVKSIIQL